jgi:Na+/proline symporter
MQNGYAPQLAALQTQFDDVFTQKRAAIRALSNASANERDAAMTRLCSFDAQARELRDRTRAILGQAGVDPKSKESDYVFITFILQQMPHGLVGLLIAVILCATMSATSAILNALGSTTAIDFYRPLIRPNASDHHYVVAAKALTAAWGLIAIGVASFASLVENLIEAGNILGSVFYGSILGLFLAGFFVRRVTGSAVFFAALLAQALVFVLFATTNIGYLWYNFIGCAAVLILAPVLQQTIFRGAEAPARV